MVRPHFLYFLHILLLLLIITIVIILYFVENYLYEIANSVEIY